MLLLPNHVSEKKIIGLKISFKKCSNRSKLVRIENFDLRLELKGHFAVI